MDGSGFVDVIGALEPAAIAGEVAELAHRRVGEALVLAVDRLAAAGRSLNQLQRIELTATVSLGMDGLEQDVLEVVSAQLDRIRATID